MMQQEHLQPAVLQAGQDSSGSPEDRLDTSSPRACCGPLRQSGSLSHLPPSSRASDIEIMNRWWAILVNDDGNAEKHGQ